MFGAKIPGMGIQLTPLLAASVELSLEGALQVLMPLMNWVEAEGSAVAAFNARLKASSTVWGCCCCTNGSAGAGAEPSPRPLDANLWTCVRYFSAARGGCRCSYCDTRDRMPFSGGIPLWFFGHLECQKKHQLIESKTWRWRSCASFVRQ